MGTGIDLQQIRNNQKKLQISGNSLKKGSQVLGLDWRELLTTEINLFGSSLLKDKDREAFYNELSILLEAGVDIKSAMELIIVEQTKPQLSRLFTNLNTTIINGKTFSAAIQQTGQFSNYEYFSIQIGEESGKIIAVLKQLSSFYTKKIKQQRQIMSALSYPIIVLCTAFGAVFFMITFVVPMFAGIFKRFGGDLPFITKLVILCSDRLKQALPYIGILIVAIAFIWGYHHKKNWYRQLSTKVLIKAPILGPLMQKVYLARFSYSMSLLISSKVPILKAIGMVRLMIDFYPIEISLAKIEELILQGVPLHKGMSQHTIFPKRMISLIKVGEEVNQLEQFFDKIAVQYTEEVEYQTTILSSLIEPIIIIFLGLIVGIILVSMYLPLFKLGNSF